MERKWGEKQSTLYHNRRQLKNSKVAKGNLCHHGDIWYMSPWHMKEGSILSSI